jgi:hypothetical protein
MDEMERRMEETNSHYKEVETNLHEQIQVLKKQMSIHEKEKRDWKKVERVLRG